MPLFSGPLPSRIAGPPVITRQPSSPRPLGPVFDQQSMRLLSEIDDDHPETAKEAKEAISEATAAAQAGAYGRSRDMAVRSTKYWHIYDKNV